MLIASCAANSKFLSKTSLKKFIPFTSYCVLKRTLSIRDEKHEVKSEQAEPAPDSESYDLAYTFPYVQIAAVVNKLKLYQTYVSGVAIPLSFALQTAGIIPMEAALPIAALSVASATAFYGAGYACSGLIGRVWVSRETAPGGVAMVGVSSVGFWGRRSELRLPAADIVPLAELPGRPAHTALYITLQRYSAPSKLKLCLRFGHVTDADAFRRAFGHAPFL